MPKHVRRRWTLLSAILCIFLAALGVLLASQSRKQDVIRELSREYSYSVFDWELELLLRFGPSWYPIPGASPGEKGSVAVTRFFGVGETIAADAVEDRSSSNKALKSAAESEIRDRIDSVLREEGLSTRVLGVDIVFPPLMFRFTKLPNLLVVSPRDRIELSQTVLLDPDLSLEEIGNLEDDVARIGVSGEVERIGGLAAYPSMVPDEGDLQFILSTVAHEWLHQYLVLRPLGRAYWSSYNMTIINETVADIAGSEIGKKAYERNYASFEKDETGQPGLQPQGRGLDYRAEMRSIRLTVDRLLEEGAIEAAESYMNERREYLEQHGYYLRKLNQAYFAFHGSYGDDPGSVSPLAGKIRQLRDRSASLGEFIEFISRVSHPLDLDRLLESQQAR